MNFRNQDAVVCDHPSKASSAKDSYSSPKMESITVTLQGVILESPGDGTGTVDPMNPEE